MRCANSTQKIGCKAYRPRHTERGQAGSVWAAKLEQWVYTAGIQTECARHCAFCLNFAVYCRILYIRWELIFAVPYMREIKVPRKNKPKALFRT